MSSYTPPVAKKIPAERVHHGDTVIDEYAWLAKAKTTPTRSPTWRRRTPTWSRRPLI
ncbi:hypothetical protein ACFSTC_01755 [Nonomuraea ferruginea]